MMSKGVFNFLDKFNESLVKSQINLNFDELKQNFKHNSNISDTLNKIYFEINNYPLEISRNFYTDLLNLFLNFKQQSNKVNLINIDILIALLDLNESSLKLFLKGYNQNFKVIFDILSDDQIHIELKFKSFDLLQFLISKNKALLQYHLINDSLSLSTLINLLNDKNQILINESLLCLLSLSLNNFEFQKIAAFQGSFDNLFNLIFNNNYLNGGILVQDALCCIQNLLKFNSSNLSFFIQMGYFKHLKILLSNNNDDLDSYTIKYWSEQLVINTAIVIDIIRLLTGFNNLEANTTCLNLGLSKLLIDLGLSSNAPITLKSQILITLSSIFSNSFKNIENFQSYQVEPIIFSQAYHLGYLRLHSIPAPLYLIHLTLNGENGKNTMIDNVPSLLGHNLMLQVAALNTFQSFIYNNDQFKYEILSSFRNSSNNDNKHTTSFTFDGNYNETYNTLILDSLINLPNESTTSFNTNKLFFASLLLSNILINSNKSKILLNQVLVQGEENDEDKLTLLHCIFGNLITCFRECDQINEINRQNLFSNQINISEDQINEEIEKQKQDENEEHENQSQSEENGENDDNDENEIEKENNIDWIRMSISYLILLSTWIWESPETVKDILVESSNLQVLIKPIKQQNEEIDQIIKGLCSFNFISIYEFNKLKSSEISKIDLYNLINKQIGLDVLNQSLIKLKVDKRFGLINNPDDCLIIAENQPKNFWFDWPTIEFLKINLFNVQKYLVKEPPSHPDTSEGKDEIDEENDRAIKENELNNLLLNKDDEIDKLKQRIEELKVENANNLMMFEKNEKQKESNVSAYFINTTILINLFTYLKLFRLTIVFMN